MKSGFTYIENFINNIDVICPNCRAKALVTSNPETRFTCTACGQSKIWEGTPNAFYTGPIVFSSGILLGKPVDCFFRYPLWYTKSVRNETLFAYNLEHLTFLENFIDNKRRERAKNEHGWSNQSLESRLPKWMLSAKNRDDIVKAIIDLKSK